MTCKAAKRTDEYHGWECEITGGACLLFYPDSKVCAKVRMRQQVTGKQSMNVVTVHG